MPVTSDARKSIREPLRILYMFLMGFLLLWYLFYIATYSSKLRVPLLIQSLRCVTAVLAIYLGGLWKKKTFWPLAALWLLLLMRVLLPHRELLADSSLQDSYFLGLWLFTGCFSLAEILTEQQLKRFLLFFASVWTAGMVLYSLAGIYAAWTDQVVRTLAGSGKWLIRSSDNRLNLVFGANTSASMLSISAMAVLILFFCTKKKAAKVLLVLSLLVMLLPMCLTGSRTAMYTFSLALGGMSGILTVHKLSRRYSTAASLAAGIAVLLLVTAVLALILRKVTPLFNQVKENGLLVSAANAESTASGAKLLNSRGLTGLNDRDTIWKAILQHLASHPLYFLTGVSMVNPMGGPNLLMTRPDFVPHAHNTLLQTLLVGGIPGLLLVITFLVFIGIRGIRLLRSSPVLPRWLYLIPILVFAVWSGELVECFIILFRATTPMQAILFVCMGIISTYGSKDRLPALSRNPAA